MPIYTYDCTKCEARDIESIATYARRDDPLQCAACDAPLKRQGCEVFALGKPAYQMKAIMRDGSKVKGHFGVTSPNKFRGKK